MSSSHHPSEQTPTGEFQRQEDAFRDWISSDGSTAYPATAGRYQRFLNAILPSFPSACGLTIERRQPQLFRVSQQFFDLMGVDAPVVTDGILIPWEVEGTCGTIWIMSHEKVEAFDAEDSRIMELLADFAAMAIRQDQQQKKLMEQANAAAAAAMANQLAHQINNPLQSTTGALYLAFGVVCGILEAQRSGKGQIVDAAMTDGASSLMAMFYGMSAGGAWKDARGSNLLDGAAHFYDTYETKDGKHIALGSIEPQFYKELIEKTGIDDPAFAAQMDCNAWPSLTEKLAAVIKTRTRDEWDAIMLGSDVCYAPVLSLAEAPKHPHNVARKTFVEVGGIVQPAPAPRFSRTEPEVKGPPEGSSPEALKAWGFSDADVAKLQSAGAI